MKDVTQTAMTQGLRREAQAGQTAQPAPGQGKDPRLWKVSQQFEAIFVQQMLQEMHKAVPHDGTLPNSFAEQVHSSMFDQAVAGTISKATDLGIASSIYRQLARLQHPQAAAHTADTISSTVTAAAALRAEGETDGTH
jgi:Rod binding domain-containing protein